MLIHGNRTAENFSLYRKSYDSEKAKQVKELFMEQTEIKYEATAG